MKALLIAAAAALFLAACGGAIDESAGTEKQVASSSHRQADLDPGGGGCGTICYHHTQWDSCLRYICGGAFPPCWFYMGTGLTSWDDCYNSCTGTWSYMLNYQYCR